MSEVVEAYVRLVQARQRFAEAMEQGLGETDPETLTWSLEELRSAIGHARAHIER